jgi:hypothetical protein
MRSPVAAPSVTSSIEAVFEEAGSAHERLEKIKKAGSLGAADDVVIGRTGDVYDPRTGEWLGTLTQP